MARISKYEQGQLASQVVGTPGVDTSGATAWNKVGAVAQDVANNLAYSAYLKQKEVDAANAELARLTTDSKVGALNMQYGVELNKIQNDVKTKTEFDTSNTVSSFTTASAEKMAVMLEGIQDPIERLKAEKRLQETFGVYQKSTSDWVETRRKPIMEANVASAASSLQDAAVASGGDPTTLQGAFNEFDKNMAQTYTALYGPEAGAKIKEAKSAAVKSVLNSVVQQPGVTDEQFEAVFRSDVVQQNTDPTDMAGLYNTFKTMVRERQVADKKEADHAQGLDRISALQEVLSLTKDGTFNTLSPTEYNNLKNSGVLDRLDPKIRVRVDAAQKIAPTKIQEHEKRQQKAEQESKNRATDPALITQTAKIVAALDVETSTLAREVREYVSKKSLTEAKTTQFNLKAARQFQQLAEAELLSMGITDPTAKAQALDRIDRAKKSLSAAIGTVKAPPKEVSKALELNAKILNYGTSGKYTPPYSPQEKAKFKLYNYFLQEEINKLTDAAKDKNLSGTLYSNKNVTTSDKKVMPYQEAVFATARRNAIKRVEQSQRGQ